VKLIEVVKILPLPYLYFSVKSTTNLPNERER
jgi:hypothetical protein